MKWSDFWGPVSTKAKGAGTLTADAKCESLGDFDELVKELHTVVRSSRDGLIPILQTTAPQKSGDLRRGIVASPAAEATAVPGKIVYDVYMDDAMNDTFVKYSSAGKRYYYPASQEYGFRLKNGGYKPGLYYMRDTSIRYESTFQQDVTDGVDRIMEGL